MEMMLEWLNELHRVLVDGIFLDSRIHWTKLMRIVSKWSIILIVAKWAVHKDKVIDYIL